VSIGVLDAPNTLDELNDDSVNLQKSLPIDADIWKEAYPYIHVSTSRKLSKKSGIC